jgi:hypothetical protein
MEAPGNGGPPARADGVAQDGAEAGACSVCGGRPYLPVSPVTEPERWICRACYAATPEGQRCAWSTGPGDDAHEGACTCCCFDRNWDHRSDGSIVCLACGECLARGTCCG